MAQQPGGVRNKIVTLESLQPPAMHEALEAVPSEPALARAPPAGRALHQIMERLRQETATAGPT